MPDVSLVQKEAIPQELESQVIFISTYLASDTDDIVNRNTNRLKGNVFCCKSFISEVLYLLVGCIFNWFGN